MALYKQFYLLTYLLCCRQCHHSIECNDLLFNFNRNYASNSYHFQVTV